MQRVNIGYPGSQYYTVRVPALESLALLLVSMAVYFQGVQIEMDKRDIAPACWLLRIRPRWRHAPLSLATCAEIPWAHFQYAGDFLLFYLSMPFGWNGEPANSPILGGSISTTHARLGMDKPGWRTSSSFSSRLYVEDGALFGLKNAMRQRANTDTLGWVGKGRLGTTAIDDDKLELEGKWGHRHTFTGVDVDSDNLSAKLPDAEIDRVRILFGRFDQKYPSRAAEVRMI